MPPELSIKPHLGLTPIPDGCHLACEPFLPKLSNPLPSTPRLAVQSRREWRCLKSIDKHHLGQCPIPLHRGRLSHRGPYLPRAGSLSCSLRPHAITYRNPRRWTFQAPGKDFRPRKAPSQVPPSQVRAPPARRARKSSPSAPRPVRSAGMLECVLTRDYDADQVTATAARRGHHYGEGHLREPLSVMPAASTKRRGIRHDRQS